jgi:hypothetical protein
MKTTFKEQRDEIISEFNYHAVLDHKEALDPKDTTTVDQLRKTLTYLLDRMIESHENGRNSISTGTAGFKVSMSYEMDGENPSLEAIYAPVVASYLADTRKTP